MLGTPPPDNLAFLPSHPPTTSQATLGPFQSQPQPPARKKKKTQPAAASPAPSDPGSTTGASDPTEYVSVLGNACTYQLFARLITSRADLFSRPRLSISRGPIFIPTVDGSEYYKTDLVGVNRVGYRYIPAGINPPGYIQPCRTIESNPTTYRVSWEDRSPSIKVTKDGLGLAGTAGFRSARCNAPMREGRWYLEVKITHGGGEHVGDESRRDGSHVRLGWGRREAPLNGPVGLDGYSYGYRDKTGETVNLSHPRPYGRSFCSGDVIGMYISLPARRQADPKDSHDPAHIKYSGKSTSSASVPSSKKTASGKLPDRSNSTSGGKQAQPALRPLPTLPNSRISFFVNGESQGIAFEGLYDYLPLRQTDSSRRGKEKKRTREGVKEHRENPFDDGSLGYYPFISLFNEACIRLNPGPEFEFPPPPDIDALLDGKIPDADDAQRNWRPVCERYAEYMQEHQQAEERKRAKMAMASEQVARVDEMYLGMNTPTLGAGNVNNGIFTVPSPSPLRCSTAYEDAAMAPQEPPLVSNVNEEAIQHDVFTFAPDGGQDPDGTISHVKQET